MEIHRWSESRPHQAGVLSEGAHAGWMNIESAFDRALWLTCGAVYKTPPSIYLESLLDYANY